MNKDVTWRALLPSNTILILLANLPPAHTVNTPTMPVPTPVATLSTVSGLKHLLY